MTSAVLPAAVALGVLCACSEPSGERAPEEGGAKDGDAGTEAAAPGSGGTVAAGGTGGMSAIEDASAGGTSGAVPDAEAGGPPQSAFVYVGSGSWGGGDGAISALRFDYGSATLDPVDQLAIGGLQSFLAFDRPRSAIYAADEAEGVLRRISVDDATGRFGAATPWSVETSGNPVYVSVNAAGSHVFVAHYDAGEAEVFPVQPGGFAPRSDLESPGAQAHAIVLSPDERFVFVPSKGADRVSVYEFDESAGLLEANTPPLVTTEPGAGPRHFTFHPGGSFAYLVNELDSTVNVYAFDGSAGTLAELQRVSTLPDGFDQASTAADLHLAPSGEFLYASNRVAGQDGSIAVYRVNADGRLDLLEHEGTRGSTPRNFGIDPTGRFVLVANQDSRSISTFRIAVGSGLLEFVGSTAVDGDPFFVGFW